MNPKPLKMLFIGAAALASSSGYASDSDRFVTASVSAVKLRLKRVDQSQSKSKHAYSPQGRLLPALLEDAKERVTKDRNQARWEAERWYTKLQNYVTSDPFDVQLEEVHRQLNVVLSLKRKFKKLDHTYPDSLKGEYLKPKITMAFGKAWAATDATDTKKITELADKLLKLRFMLSDFDDWVHFVNMPTEGIYKGSYNFDLVDKRFDFFEWASRAQQRSAGLPDPVPDDEE